MIYNNQNITKLPKYTVNPTSDIWNTEVRITIEDNGYKETFTVSKRCETFIFMMCDQLYANFKSKIAHGLYRVI